MHCDLNFRDMTLNPLGHGQHQCEVSLKSKLPAKSYDPDKMHAICELDLGHL